ncbi:MAG: hypothetical protein QOH06_4416 [Acidobacteriota bacterium]|jgi:hypothetical protein|nr:hypothetical protein [Acidobacteriota bacterium]
MIHRTAVSLLLLGLLGCPDPPAVEPLRMPHPPQPPELPGPGRADARGFRPECTALIPYKLQPPIVPPKAVELVSPNFGPFARRTMRMTGTVILEAVIDESGHTCDVRVLKGLHSAVPPQAFAEPIREALLKSRFRPATFGEVPIAVVYRLTVKIDL